MKVSKLSTARREALDALYKIYRSTNDLPNLRQTAQRLQQSSPEEVSLEANAARLALLLDRNTAEGRKLAKQAYEKSPNDINVAVTYVFSLYSTGRTTEGLEILQKLPPEQLRDPHIAVYAALLSMTTIRSISPTNTLPWPKPAPFIRRKNSSWRRSPVTARA